MSIQNGVWHDALLDPPPNGEIVLCVKQNQKGDRNLCFGSYWRERFHDDNYDDRWVTSGGCRKIIFWMPLPKIPGTGDSVIIETGWKCNLKQKCPDLKDFKDCVNELCQQCGQYKREHEGACDDCRWLKQRRGW